MEGQDRKIDLIRKYKYKRFDMIPCGQCIGCRLESSRQWAHRIMLESKKNDNNHFITLTYDDLHVPSKTVLNEETGELTEVKTLQKKDMSDFMKKLRAHYEYRGHENIRFFGAGEYGDKTDRPHMHMCIFNLPIDDLKFYKPNKDGMPMYTSAKLEKIWGKGFVVIAELNFETAAYTARYIMKKQTGLGADYEGREPEFTQMSRRPGIGRSYYNENKEKIYKNDEMPLNGHMVKPPKYFDNIKKEEDPEGFQTTRNKRLVTSKQKNELKMSRTTLTQEEQRAVAERKKLEQIRTLKRDL